MKNLIPLWGSFYPIVCRELPFAVTKFGAFELIVAIFDHGIGDTMGVKVSSGKMQSGRAHRWHEGWH